jgi:hypothetical protein
VTSADYQPHRHRRPLDLDEPPGDGNCGRRDRGYGRDDARGVRREYLVEQPETDDVEHAANAPNTRS